MKASDDMYQGFLSTSWKTASVSDQNQTRKWDQFF